jgi:hypothetical protein
VQWKFAIEFEGEEQQEAKYYAGELMSKSAENQQRKIIGATEDPRNVHNVL